MANDYFSFRRFTVRQERCAMKVGTDGTLLGAWASVPTSLPHPTTGPSPRILDIGTGTSLIALMMAQRFPEAEVTGVDIDAEAVAQARENVAASPFAGRINVICADVRTMASDHDCLYEAIVCNPPYFENSLQCPDGRRSIARHAGTLSLRELMECVRRLLADSGEFSVVIPTDGKQRLETEAALAGLFKVRQCAVHTKPTKGPKRHLMAFRKHPANLQTDELLMGSERYRQLTKEFYI